MGTVKTTDPASILTVEITGYDSIHTGAGCIHVYTESGEEIIASSLKLNYEPDDIVTATIVVPVCIKTK